MTKNILDNNGNVIGTLTLPDNTSDAAWAAALAPYAQAPAVISTQQYVENAIQDAINFGAQIMLQYAASNVLLGITQAGQTQAVANYLQQTLLYLQSGSLYAAIAQINVYIADTSSTKAALSPYVTNAVLTSFKNQIQAWLGIPQD